MKVLKKVLKWSLISAFLFGVLSVLGLAFYLETSIDRVASKEKQEMVWTSFNESETLPEKFYTTIEKYYPRYFTLGVWESELRFYLGLKCSSSPYNQLYVHPAFADTLGLFWQKIILFELEEQCTSRKCYDYLMHFSYFEFGERNIKDAAQFYYKKELQNLTEREILELHLIKEAPTYYNPIRNKGKLDEKVNEVINRQK